MDFESPKHSVRLSTLNPALRERVEKFDTCNDGELDINEAIQGLITLQKQSNNYKKMIWLLIPVLCMVLAGSFGTTILAINLTKEVKSSTIEGNIPVLKTTNGEYTQSLVDINKQTILSGAKREESAIQMLNNRFGEGTIIKRFCSGDKRDTLKGQDLLVETPKGTFTVQVKPYGTIKKFIDDEGSIYYEVNARGYNSTKYSPKNVQTIVFVHDDNFIVFSNSRSKIGNVSDGVTRFYEEPLYTNMVFDKENKKNRSTTTRMVKDVFNYGDKESEIQRLELKKAAIDRLISKIQNNL